MLVRFLWAERHRLYVVQMYIFLIFCGRLIGRNQIKYLFTNSLQKHCVALMKTHENRWTLCTHKLNETPPVFHWETRCHMEQSKIVHVHEAADRDTFAGYAPLFGKELRKKKENLKKPWRGEANANHTNKIIRPFNGNGQQPNSYQKYYNIHMHAHVVDLLGLALLPTRFPWIFQQTTFSESDF